MHDSCAHAPQVRIILFLAVVAWAWSWQVIHIIHVFFNHFTPVMSSGGNPTGIFYGSGLGLGLAWPPEVAPDYWVSFLEVLCGSLLAVRRCGQNEGVSRQCIHLWLSGRKSQPRTFLFVDLSTIRRDWLCFLFLCALVLPLVYPRLPPCIRRKC